MFINFEHCPPTFSPRIFFFFELKTQDFAALGAYVSDYIRVLVPDGRLPVTYQPASLVAHHRQIDLEICIFAYVRAPLARRARVQ